MVSDLESAGWIERYSAQDPSLAPAGEQLAQAQMPIRPDEVPDAAAMRMEDCSTPPTRAGGSASTWKRRQVMDGRSGALDLPGTTWRDRPAIDRGDGIFLCGDQVAAPGCLSEVSFASAIEAGTGALEFGRHGALHTAAPTH